MRKSLGRLLLSALLPFGKHVNGFVNGAQVVVALAAILGLPVLSVKNGGVPWWPWGVVIFLIFLVGFLLLAGGRLQREADRRREELGIDLTAQAIPTVHNHQPVAGVQYVDHVSFWVTVRNRGPLARFQARLETADNHPLIAEYGISLLAWQQDDAVNVQIARDAWQEIHLASFSRRPRAFHWLTGQKGTGTKRLGSQPTVVNEDESLEVNFTLVVDNLDADTNYSATGRITIGMGDAAPTITIEAS